MNQTFSSDLPVLIVDDEAIVLKAISRALQSNGISNVIAVSDSREVMTVMKKHDVAFVLLDLAMPHITGEDLLVSITEEFPHIPVIMATANDDVSTIVSSIKKGAFDCIVKPIDTGRLLSAARCAIEIRELRNENQRLQSTQQSGKVSSLSAFGHIKTQNDKMMAVFRYIEAVAQTSQPLIITGETGVGKDLIVKAVSVKRNPQFLRK